MNKAYNSRKRDSRNIILIQLAINGPQNTLELIHKNNLKTRTLYRDLKLLEQAGLINKEGSIKRSYQGRPADIWRITLGGLIGFVKDNHQEIVDKAINNNSFLSLVFRKWPYISNYPGKDNLDFKEFITDRVRGSSIGTRQVDRKTLSEIGNLNQKVKEISWLQFDVFKRDNEERLFLKEVFFIDEILRGSVTFAPYTIPGGPTIKADDIPIVQYFKYLLNEPEIRGFIINELRYAEAQNMIVQEIKAKYHLSV